MPGDTFFAALLRLAVRLGGAVVRLVQGKTTPPPAPAQDEIDGRMDAALEQKRDDETREAEAEDLYDEAAVEHAAGDDS